MPRYDFKHYIPDKKFNTDIGSLGEKLTDKGFLGLRGSSDEHKALVEAYSKVAKFADENVSNHKAGTRDYEEYEQKKLDLMEDARKAAKKYIEHILKEHGKTSVDDDWTPRTPMGKKRYKAAKALIEAIDIEEEFIRQKNEKLEKERKVEKKREEKRRGYEEPRDILDSIKEIDPDMKYDKMASQIHDLSARYITARFFEKNGWDKNTKDFEDNVQMVRDSQAFKETMLELGGPGHSGLRNIQKNIIKSKGDKLYGGFWSNFSRIECGERMREKAAEQGIRVYSSTHEAEASKKMMMGNH